jgi:uncharacterized membrane protein
MREKYKNYVNNDHNFDKERWIGIFCLIIVIGGIFGFVYEYIFYYFNGGMKAFYWRGGNFLPWINIYAIGGLIVYKLTYQHRNSPLKVFLTSLISCGVLEFISGWGLARFGLRYWNYNNEILNLGNINGYICLRSILFFGISGVFFIYVIVPFCFYLAKNMSKKHFMIMSISLCTIFLFDEFYNLLFARLLSLPTAYEVYSKLGMNYMK